MHCHSQDQPQKVTRQFEQQAKAVGDHRGVHAAALRQQKLRLELRIAMFDPRRHRGEVMIGALRGAERLPLSNVSTVT